MRFAQVIAGSALLTCIAAIPTKRAELPSLPELPTSDLPVKVPRGLIEEPELPETPELPKRAPIEEIVSHVEEEVKSLTHPKRTPDDEVVSHVEDEAKSLVGEKRAPIDETVSQAEEEAKSLTHLARGESSVPELPSLDAIVKHLEITIEEHLSALQAEKLLQYLLHVVADDAVQSVKARDLPVALPELPSLSIICQELHITVASIEEHLSQIDAEKLIGYLVHVVGDDVVGTVIKRGETSELAALPSLQEIIKTLGITIESVKEHLTEVDAEKLISYLEHVVASDVLSGAKHARADASAPAPVGK